MRIPHPLIKKPYSLFIGIVVVLGIIRLCLPFLVQRYVNRVLSQLTDYKGHIGHVRLALLRGAYQIRDIEIVKTSGKIPVPFFKAPVMDLSVEWKQLFNRAFVGEIVFFEPQLNFVMTKSKTEAQLGQHENWTDVVRQLFPIKINRLEVRRGNLHYRDYDGNPPVDVFISNLNMIAKNLTNSEKLSKTLAATLSGSGVGMKTADINFSVNFNVYNSSPTFDLKFEMKNLNVPEINSYLRHYADIDVEKGRMDLYMEAAANNGQLKGYSKPFLKDLKFLDLKKEKPTFTKAVKETFAQVVAWFFKNNKQKTTATRIPISNTIEHPELGLWPAIGSSFHHAFIQALHQGLE